jgi:hypothetical protein
MRHLILILSSFVLIAGCAKNRGIEPLRYDEKKDWLAKNDFTGAGAERDIYCTKITAVKNSNDGGFIFSGNQSDMRCGYFDFTEDKMQFKSTQGPYKGRDNAASATPIILQWPVTHHQNQLNTVDGKTVNKEIDDDRLKFNEKNFFVIDFASPDISEQDSFTGDSKCWTVKSRRRVDGSVDVQPGYISFLVEVVYNRECPTSWEPLHNGFTNYTVQYRYSFKKWEASTTYKPFAYEGELDPNMRKFGYFQSIKEELNPKDGRMKNIFFINRWDPTKTHHFFFTKNTPDEYKYIFVDIFKKTNEIFEKANLKTRFEIHENTDIDGKEKNLGDLRYSFINIVEEADPSAPLGYGPSDADPFTGEIISANLNIWTSSLKDYIRRIKKSSARVPTKWQDSDLYVKMSEFLKMTPDQWGTAWESSDKRAIFLQHMTQETTYGYPGFNAFTLTPNLASVEAFVDKPTPFNKMAGGVKAQNIFTMDKSLFADKSQWVKELYNVKEKDSKFTVQPSLTNFTPLEQRAVFNLLKSGTTTSGDMAGAEMLSQLSTEIEKHDKDTLAAIKGNIRGHCVMDVEGALGGMDPQIIEGFTNEEIAHNIVYRTAIHEFGHNLNLRHNFYGSVDHNNFPEPSVPKMKVDDKGQLVQSVGADGKPELWPTVSSTVMDYLRLQDDYFTERGWEPYDVAAIRYAYSGGKLDDGKLYLFCTDEATATNALCNKFDRGWTPSQVAMSFIDAYEDGYYTRNYRDGRAYWNTGAYMSGIVGTMRELKEFLPMWRAAFYETNMREQLKKKGFGKDESEQMITEMNREIKKAIKLTLAFYQSVLQQSNVDKPYRSEYDLGTGALQRMGIGTDKLVAMYFMAGDDALFYNPNRVMLNASYMSYMYDPDFAVMLEQIQENIVTQRVDMEPWFISFGRDLFAKSAMDYSNRDDQTMINKIKVKRYAAHEIRSYFDYDLADAGNAAKTANLVTLKTSQDADFKAGEQVALIRSNTNYYVFSKQQNPFAFDIYKNIKSAEDAQSSATEGQLDLQELYYIYTFYTTIGLN